MHALFIVFIVIVSASFYLGTGGFLGMKFYASRKRAHRCAGMACHLDHEVAPVFIGLFWPLALPLIGGMLLGGGNTSRGSRNERRRDEELTEAQHQTALAQEQARAARYLFEQEQALRIGSHS